MNRIVEWAKAHPKLSIALGLGIVVLIYLYTRSSSSTAQSATVGSTGLSEQGYLSMNASELAAATQLQGQQIAASTATTQLTDQLQAQQTNDATQIALANIQASAGLNATYAQSAVDLQNISAQEAVALETIKANEQTSADQLSLEQSLIGVLAGRNNVVNPTPPSANFNPVVVSSGPGVGFAAAPEGPAITPAPAYGPAYQAPEPSSLSFRGVTVPVAVPYSPNHLAVLPGTPPAGYGLTPGVDYATNPGAAYMPTYAFGNPQQAGAAGAVAFNPATGTYSAAPGVTY